MHRWMILAVMSLTVACGGKDDDDDDDDDDTAGDDGGDDDTAGDDGGDDGGSDGPEPVITEADAWCYTPGGSVEGDWWALKAVIADPQGADTLEAFQPQGVRVDTSSGGTVATMALVCDGSTGICTGSDSVANLGFGCSSAADMSFVFAVIDEDGNMSEAVSIAGRQGTSAEGR
jgi:hypothetical protein